jgi:outer membrane protein assembly complex protein YaeT
LKQNALLLLMALSFAGPLAAQDLPEVRKITFTGAESFDETLLSAAIISTETNCNLLGICAFGVDRRYLDPIELRGDLVRLRMFYYQRGFRQARIGLDSTMTDKGIEIAFTISEGEPVRVATLGVIGAEGLGSLPLKVGNPFSLIDYSSARDSIAARLANRGYARAEVLANYTIPRDTPLIAHVEFEVVPGDRLRFGPIAVEGQEKMSPGVIRRMLTFDTGDYYSYNDVLRSQRNLFGLETFRHVEIRADVNATPDTLVPVIVQVSEGNLRRLRFGVGVSTAEFVNTEASWTSRNFLGSARRVEARVRLYNIMADALHFVPLFEKTREPYSDLSGSVSVDFSQPWLISPRNSVNAGLYAERRSLPDIFVRNARGGYLNVTRALGVGESFAIGYRPELTELSAGGDLVFCVNFVACGADEIAVLREPHWLSPLAVSYARDKSNSLFAPSGGYIIRFEGEYAAAATGSDFAYSRVIAEITDYSTLTRGVVLAARIRPGWARALGEPGQGLGLHPQKRFFGGGPNSVRGFAQYRMGPKLLTVNAADFLMQHCTAEQINAGTCEVGPLVDIDPGAFEVRPVGGSAIVEGNVELRLPTPVDKLRFAAFLDYGHVWQASRDAEVRDIVLTPGFGLRFFSAIGPVRVDVGYNPRTEERLPVITTQVACGDIGCTNTSELVELGDVAWGRVDDWSDRFQLHFSIGQAF